MTFLVTGANGQLGRTFHKFRKNDRKFIFMGHSEFDLTNINDIVLKLNQIQPKIIINCAAYTSVDKSEENKELAFLINSESVGHIADWSKKNNCYFFHYSTDYVFDGFKKTAFSEKDAPNPLNTYGKSKLKGEQFFYDSGCHGICFRTSWVHSNFGNN